MASSGHPQSPERLSEAEAYYRSALDSKAQRTFGDIDDAAFWTTTLQNIQNYATRNFVLDFSDAAARISCDLPTQAMDALLETERPDSLHTRWINIWFPQQQSTLIESLARKYDFTPRLFALMVSNPMQFKQTQYPLSAYKSASGESGNRRFLQRHKDTEIEKGSDGFSELSTVSSQDSVMRGNLYKIINDIWHYTSIDFGRSYVCLGYNSLYGIESAEEHTVEGRLPQCIRLWTWLLLCDDSTVISINEDPFPFSGGRLNRFQQRVVAETRRNLVSIVRSLSNGDEDSLMAEKPLAMFPIRTRVGNTSEETAHRLSDTPGLLFYYLFENWHNSYSLITRRESRYGDDLRKLRAEMFEKPTLGHIDRLDMIGNELGVLKRHFEGYNRLIERLLEPKTVTNASLQNYRVATQSSQASLDTVRQTVNGQESTLGVSLSSPTRVRFERLKDLIDLYAMTEIEEAIKQKDSMVAMVGYSLLLATRHR